MTSQRVLLAGIEGGALHIARRHRGAIDTACFHRIATNKITQLRETRAEIHRAFDLEWICIDCETLRNRGSEGFRQATGW